MELTKENKRLLRGIREAQVFLDLDTDSWLFSETAPDDQVVNIILKSFLAHQCAEVERTHKGEGKRIHLQALADLDMGNV